MLNVVLPIYGGLNQGTSENYEDQPLILNTVKDRPIIAWSLSHIDPIPMEKRYFVISTEQYFNKHHIDKLLPLFTDNEINFVGFKA